MAVSFQCMTKFTTNKKKRLKKRKKNFTTKKKSYTITNNTTANTCITVYFTPLFIFLPNSLKSEGDTHSVMSTSFETPQTVACQAPLSMEFSRQEYMNK